MTDRAFNSVITITPKAVLIQGTRFGTKAELEASAVYIHLKKLSAKLEISELDWLASILAWATDEAENFAGGVVSPFHSAHTTHGSKLSR